MKNYLIIILLLIGVDAFAQNVSGKVLEVGDDRKEQPVIGANVYWLGTATGTTTDVDGHYSLAAPAQLPARLIISFVGFANDTMLVQNVPVEGMKTVLKPSINLGEFEVVDRQQGTTISTITPINIENISTKELQKAACCNLSESFETNATVDVVVADAISGSKKIQMLGLDGVYSQIQAENIPILRGLSSSRGLDYIPGTWVESIQVTKGLGPVVNGYESITGLINVEYQKPDDSDKLFLNLYGNAMSRAEANMHYATKLNEKWSTMLFLHGNNTSRLNDRNKDGFLDRPVGTHFGVMNRWKYFGEKRAFQLMVNVQQEDKQAGQTDFDFNEDFGTPNSYGIGLNTEQYEVYMKNGFLMPERPDQSIGIITSVSKYKTKSYFGFKEYFGEQHSAYLNAIHQQMLGNTFHTLKTGVSYKGDKFDEMYNDSSFTRTESVPGAFAEYTYNNNSNVSVVLGVRGDYHNLYGTLFNPRMHFKYNYTARGAVRLSAGKGLRVANPFVENAGLLASSREVIVLEQPNPEEATNLGISLTQKFQLFGDDAAFNVDYFRTDFINQVVVDLDQNPQQALIYNLDGVSFSNSVQADLSVEPAERLEVKLSYKYLDVKTTYHGELLEKALVPKDRALFNIGYETGDEKWLFDATVNWFGQKRIPNTSTNPDGFRLNQHSDEFYTLNAQITKEFKYFEWYVGAENLLDFKQENAIVSANDPFGTYFDASMIWGPVNGRTIYSGLRFKIR